jgi:molybdopterin molybdotransferase
VTRQRLGTLMPLAEVERWIEANVARTERTATAAAGVLAAELVAPRTLPSHPSAAIDGFAVRADDTTGASLYTPTPIDAFWVDQDMRLPDSCDAVAAPRGVRVDDDVEEAVEPVGPGDDVRGVGFEARAGETMRPAGGPATVATIAAAEGLGAAVAVARPRIVCLGRRDGDWPAAAFRSLGAEVETEVAREPELLESFLLWAEADALVVVGGTGEGRDDDSVAMLAIAGTVAFHGIALDPGATAAIGLVRGRLVLCLPGRPDAGLAVALTLGRALMRRLMGAGQRPVPMLRGRLTRKIVGSPGKTRLVYVDVVGDAVEPLGSGNLPLSALARALGCIILPPGVEGHPAGASVDVLPLPGYVAL